MSPEEESVVAETITVAIKDLETALMMASAITVVRCDEAAVNELEVDGINDEAAEKALGWLIRRSSPPSTAD